MFDRSLPETFILEHYYFSMVTYVITPEKYDSAVKIFLTCIFLFKSEKTRIFHVFFNFSTKSVFQGLFYGCIIFLVCVHHWIDYYSPVSKPENAKRWLRIVGLVCLTHRLSAKFVRIRWFYCSVRNPFIVELFYWSTTTFRRSRIYTRIPSTCTNVNPLLKIFDCLKIYGFRKSAVKSANSGRFGSSKKPSRDVTNQVLSFRAYELTDEW